MDNIPKPILDELKGMVFKDDSQVTDLLCRRRDLQGALRVRNPSPLLLESFVKSEITVHVAVVQSLDQEVVL